MNTECYIKMDLNDHLENLVFCVGTLQANVFQS